MKIWHRSKGENFGKTLLAWRHQSTGRFINKIGSWLLGGFVMGILASIFFKLIGLADMGLYAGRAVFFLVFFFGVLSAFFRNIVNGLEYRVTEKALLHVQPLCGMASLSKFMAATFRLRWERITFLPWEEIKSVQDQEGHLHLTLKGDTMLSIQVTPVRSIDIASGGDALEQRSHDKGLFGHDAGFDKETVKLIAQRIRDVRKQAAGK